MKRVNTPAAISNGNHPPWTTLRKLAEKKSTSMLNKRQPIGATFQRGLRQRTWRITRNKIVVVMNVPVTATPYAKANLADEPKPTTIREIPASKIQFTAGT